MIIYNKKLTLNQQINRTDKILKLLQMSMDIKNETYLKFKKCREIMLNVFIC